MITHRLKQPECGYKFLLGSQNRLVSGLDTTSCGRGVGRYGRRRDVSMQTGNG